MKTIELDYENKVAVVTGAASGMGLLASRELAAAGAKVVMCDVNAEALEREASALSAAPAATAAGGAAVPRLCDVRRWEDAQAAAALALDRFGRLDLLFNFAKGLAKAGAPHGVRAFCVSPGPVLTRPGMANMKTLLGRAADPSEVVDFILYLASGKGAFVTGTNHVIDGGRLCVPR